MHSHVGGFKELSFCSDLHPSYVIIASSSFFETEDISSSSFPCISSKVLIINMDFCITSLSKLYLVNSHRKFSKIQIS